MAAGSILETFLILFKTNADEVVEGNKEVKSSTERLEEALSKTDVKTQAVGHAFLEMASHATGAITALLSVGAILHGVFESAHVADELYNVSQALGVSAEDISSWGRAVEQFGGQAQDFQMDLTGMSRDFEQLATIGTSRLLPFFQTLGINVMDAQGKVRKVLDVLPDLADKFSTISRQEALGFGTRLGLSQGTILLLQQGRREVAAMVQQQKDLGAITDKQTQIANDYDDALKNLRTAMMASSLTIAENLLPPLTALIGYVIDFVIFMHQHRDVAVGFFIAIAGAVMAYAVPAFLTLMAATVEIWGPIALIVAIVGALAAAFALAYEDVMTFVKGGDSLIGRVLNWANSFEMFREAVKALGEAFDWVTDKASKLWGWFEKINGTNITATGQLVGVAQQQMAFAASSPLAGTTTGAITAGASNNSRSSSLHIGEVNVHTQATDAEGIAGAIGGHMSQQMRQAQQNFDDGVAA